MEMTHNVFEILRIAFGITCMIVGTSMFFGVNITPLTFTKGISNRKSKKIKQ